MNVKKDKNGHYVFPVRGRVSVSLHIRTLSHNYGVLYCRDWLLVDGRDTLPPSLPPWSETSLHFWEEEEVSDDVIFGG